MNSFCDCPQENAALCDQVAEVQQQVVVAAEERIFLLKRLLQHQTTNDNHSQLPAKVNLTGELLIYQIY